MNDETLIRELILTESRVERLQLSALHRCFMADQHPSDDADADRREVMTALHAAEQHLHHLRRGIEDRGGMAALLRRLAHTIESQLSRDQSCRH